MIIKFLINNDHLITKLYLLSIFFVIYIMVSFCFLPAQAAAFEEDLFTGVAENQDAGAIEPLTVDRPVGPYPKNKASGVDINTILSWQTGANRDNNDIYYLIYFGTAKNPELHAAIWPYDTGSRVVFEPDLLEPDSHYYWQVEARDRHNNTNRSPLWSFNTFAAISGMVTEDDSVLAGEEVIVLAYLGDGEWEQAALVETAEDGSYLAPGLPGGNYLIGLAGKDCWYPKLLTLNGGQHEEINLDKGAYDLEIVLNEGMNLLSLPRWAAADGIIFSQPFDEYVKSWMTYWEGAWENGSSEEPLIEALNNPVRAVYINVLQPTVLQFKWKEITTGLKYASQVLQPGWNLVSSSYEEDYRLVLAGLADFGSGGITDVSAPNEPNGRKGFSYHLPWQTPIVSITSPEAGNKPIMYPLDGYWVYLEGEPQEYKTMVSSAEVEKILIVED